MRKVNKLTPFGKAVKTRLIEMDMSVRDLAKEINTSPVQISRILHGEQPGYEIVPKMLDVLGADTGRAAQHLGQSVRKRCV